MTNIKETCSLMGKKRTKFVSTFVVNMDQVPHHTDRIIMAYYSSHRNSRPRIFKSLSLRVGNSVLSIRRQSQMSIVRMLRNTLIALLICHRFIYTARFVRSHYIQNARLLALSLTLRKKYERYSIQRLLILYIPYNVTLSEGESSLNPESRGYNRP